MWKWIPGYEGYYEINEDGVIRSAERAIQKSDGVTQIRKSKIVAQSLTSDGYLRVKLHKDGKQKGYAVHRLVGLLFVDGYSPDKEINHKDCVRTNNNYTNLEWVTHAENIEYTKSLKRHVSDKDIAGANNPNYHNDTLRKRFMAEPELRLVQSRPGARNGRARPIRAYFPDGEAMDFSYIGECAKYLIDNNYLNNKNISGLCTNIRKSAECSKKYKSFAFELL